MMNQASATIPDFVQAVVDEAVERLSPRRIILFGSRARGDAARASDYDLAVDAPGLDDADWARFVLDAREGFGALLELDLVRLDEANPAFRQRIEREGKVLYVSR